MSNREQKAYYVALFYLNDQSEDYKVICSCCYLLPRHLEYGLFCLGVTIQMDSCAGGKHPECSVGLHLKKNDKRFPTVNKLSLCLNNRSRSVKFSKIFLQLRRLILSVLDLSRFVRWELCILLFSVVVA